MDYLAYLDFIGIRLDAEIFLVLLMWMLLIEVADLLALMVWAPLVGGVKA